MGCATTRTSRWVSAVDDSLEFASRAFQGARP
jgi:hypothetical protein